MTLSLIPFLLAVALFATAIAVKLAHPEPEPRRFSWRTLNVVIRVAHDQP